MTYSTPGAWTEEEREKWDSDGSRIDFVETAVLASIARGPSMDLSEHCETVVADDSLVLDAIDYLVSEGYVVEDPSDSDDPGLAYARQVFDGEYISYMITPKGRHQLGVETSILVESVQFIRRATDDVIPIYRGDET